MVFYKIRPKSGTKAQWQQANTVLGEREIGFEVPTGGVGSGAVKMKMGDGATPWNSLPYATTYIDSVKIGTSYDDGADVKLLFKTTE